MIPFLSLRSEICFSMSPYPPGPLIGYFGSIRRNGLDSLETDLSRSPDEITLIVVMSYDNSSLGHPKLPRSPSEVLWSLGA